MTAAELTLEIGNESLNCKLAEALGWEIYTDPAPYCTQWWVDGEGQAVEAVGYFSPATSSDHLRLYVLPEVDRRGLKHAFMDSCFQPSCALGLDDDDDTYGWWLLNASPSVLAAAALKVLEGGE